MPNIVWFRSDLRVVDNTALAEALQRSDSVVGVYLLTPKQWKQHSWGAAKVDFLLRNLDVLSKRLEQKNIPLVIRSDSTFSDAPSSLLTLSKELKAESIYFNYEYEWNERLRDRAVRDAFQREGLTAVGFHDQTIIPPNDESLVTQQGKPYTVFTPFRKRWLELARKRGIEVLPCPPSSSSIVKMESDIVPRSISGFECSPHIKSVWPAGEDEAQKRLEGFCQNEISSYQDRRDIPSVPGTSTLSPYLAIGAISPRQCLSAAIQANGGSLSLEKNGASTWISELIWREFYRHVMIHHPRICKYVAFKKEVDEAVPWRYDEAEFARWKNGETGYPIIDAAMRSLKRNGWMHNRLRMVVAMFLTKHLLIDWRWGEKHFAENLIDLDLASNNGGWQWSASVGTDAVPYFRIFNPWSQSKKIDSEGKFIKEYCPELSSVFSASLHDPEKLAAEIKVGVDYPSPMIEHQRGRERALAAFKA